MLRLGVGHWLDRRPGQPLQEWLSVSRPIRSTLLLTLGGERRGEEAAGNKTLVGSACPPGADCEGVLHGAPDAPRLDQ
jgi:hypothetical protein